MRERERESEREREQKKRGRETEGEELYELEKCKTIIIPLGILSDVLTFMQAEIQSLSSSKNHKKLTECFHFLQALACQNAVVQKR